MGLVQLKQKVSGIKHIELQSFKNKQSDNATGQVRSLVLGYERLMMKESEDPLKIKKVYNFGDKLEMTYESPSKKRRLCQAEQAGSRGSSSSPALRSKRRWQTGPAPSIPPRPPTSSTAWAGTVCPAIGPPPPSTSTWESSLLGLTGSMSGSAAGGQSTLFTTNYKQGRQGDKMEYIPATTIVCVERDGMCRRIFLPLPLHD